MDIIFSEFLLLYQIFFSLQVQRSVIISNKHDIYELPDELPNDLRLRILQNQERSRKSKSFMLPTRMPRSKSPSPQPAQAPARNAYTAQKQICPRKGNSQPHMHTEPYTRKRSPCKSVKFGSIVLAFHYISRFNASLSLYTTL